MQPRNPSTEAGRAWKPAPTGCGEVGARNQRCRSSGKWRTEDGAPYDVLGTFPHRNYAIRHPAEGASGMPPPTGCAIG